MFMCPCVYMWQCTLVQMCSPSLMAGCPCDCAGVFEHIWYLHTSTWSQLFFFVLPSCISWLLIQPNNLIILRARPPVFSRTPLASCVNRRNQTTRPRGRWWNSNIQCWMLLLISPTCFYLYPLWLWCRICLSSAPTMSCSTFFSHCLFMRYHGSISMWAHIF